MFVMFVMFQKAISFISPRKYLYIYFSYAIGTHHKHHNLTMRILLTYFCDVIIF